MTASAYEWFLAVEIARAESEARRHRVMQDRESFRRRAAQAIALHVTGPRRVARGRRSSETAALRPEPVPVRSVKVKDKALPATSELRDRFAERLASITSLAEGFEPVVIRLVSFGRGLRQILATVTRWLPAAATLESHDSQSFSDAAMVEREVQHWASDFDDRGVSQDAVVVGATLPAGVGSDQGQRLLRQSIAAAFGGHALAEMVPAVGATETSTVTTVLVLAGARGRLRLEQGDEGWKFMAASQQQMALRLQQAGLPQPSFELISAPLHGEVAMRGLLVASVAKASLRCGDESISSKAEALNLARRWAAQLRSHAPRQTMHLLLTARCTSLPEREAFRRAVRRFLHEAFADHKFIFGVEAKSAEKIQARAMVTMRSETGPKLRPDRAMFEGWRMGFATAAQDEGLKLVATNSFALNNGQTRLRRDSPRLKGNLLGMGRASAQRWAVTPRQRALAEEALAAWRLVSLSDPGKEKAAQQILQLEACLNGGTFLQSLIAKSREIESGVLPDALETQLSAMESIVADAVAALDQREGEAFAARATHLIAALRRRVNGSPGAVRRV